MNHLANSLGEQRVIGHRVNDGDIAGAARADALRDQSSRINQQPRTRAFEQILLIEMADLHAHQRE